MEMPKASDADKAHFRSLVPELHEVVIKPMFGNLGAFVNGNMFAGLFGPTIGVKLSEADKAAPGDRKTPAALRSASADQGLAASSAAAKETANRAHQILTEP